MPIDRPVTMLGAAPGRITSANMAPAAACPGCAPRRSGARRRPSTPWMVLSRIGNSAPMKVMKTMRHLGRGEHQDRQRDPGHRRDRAAALPAAAAAVFGQARAADQQAQADADQRGEHEAGEHARTGWRPGAGHSLGDCEQAQRRVEHLGGGGTFSKVTRPRSTWCVEATARCHSSRQAASDSDAQQPAAAPAGAARRRSRSVSRRARSRARCLAWSFRSRQRGAWRAALERGEVEHLAALFLRRIGLGSRPSAGRR